MALPGFDVHQSRSNRCALTRRAPGDADTATYCFELSKTFSVDIGNAVSVTLAETHATVTIVNDDNSTRHEY